MRACARLGRHIADPSCEVITGREDHFERAYAARKAKEAAAGGDYSIDDVDGDD